MAACLLFSTLPPELRPLIYRYVLMRSEQPVQLLRSPSNNQSIDRSQTAILQVCRHIFNEAYPVLLSANTWLIRPTRADHTWLSGLSLRGRTNLHRVILDVDYDYATTGHYDLYAKIFNALSSCARLSLTIRGGTWTLLRLYREETMKYIHGFAKATMDELSNEPSRCWHHGKMDILPDHVVAQRDRTWKSTLDHLTSPCLEDCRKHVARPASRNDNNVHLDLISLCFYCEQEQMERVDLLS